MPTNKKNLSCKPPAIQGKLTEQLPTDGDAKDLLKQIQAEKINSLRKAKLNLIKNYRPSRRRKFLSIFLQIGLGVGSVIFATMEQTRLYF